ncbi:hypothetical protein HLH17_06775 [Acinetobacter sp. ANC 5380]|uniref:Lipoprotein n=1 Tax=Acinetobacter terrae TaxID=2731247 RepID=A0A7Y2WAK3_9GAMM|nr:hypothetical protein [Acinetobacter terrae]NNH77377.1 hypothetical protein [Acinetobacter terrae]
MKIYSILFLSLALLGCSKEKESTETYDVSAEAAVAVASEAVAEVSIEPEDQWQYETTKDEMRGIEKQYASIHSSNQVHFDFPYEGGSNLNITLRRDVGKPTDVYFSISKGQFTCDTFNNNCYASIKIDDGPVENISLVGTKDYSSEILFIESDHDSKQFIQRIKKANQVIVELPFYQGGRQQFKFDIDGLKWDL